MTNKEIQQAATVYYYLYPELAIRRPVRVGEVWLKKLLDEIPPVKRWMVSRKISQMAKKQNR